MANNASSLVHRLNALLAKLRIPINVEFPTDLTPSLLLAILESILSARIPIDPDLRRRLTTQRDFDAKVRCMKLFLGVLESDVLKVDVNLDKVDPRKLARGDWDEVVYVGELLCQIGELLGLLPQGAKRGLPVAPTFSNSGTPTSARRARRATVNTSAPASTSVDRSASSDPGPQRSFASLTSPIPGTSRERRTRRCIHALQTPELLSTRKHLFDTSALAEDFTTCNCPAADIPHLAPSKRSKSTSSSPRSTGAATVPVRRNGYIQSVDEDEELHSFESARSTTIGDEDEDTSRFSFEHISSILANLDLEEAESWSHARTLQLKRERARLLSELAKYETPQ